MRGQVFEITLISIIVVVFFIVLVFAQYILDDFIENDPKFTEDATKTAISDASQDGLDVLGGSVLLVFWGSVIAMAIAAFFIQSHPIFFVASLIIFIVSIPVLVMVTNITMDVVTMEDIESSAEKHTEGLQTVGNIPIAAAIGACIVMVALYAKFG